MTERAIAVAQELADAYPVRQAARMLRLSANSMYVAATQGRLRLLRVGGKLYVPQAEVERILLAADAKATP